MKKFYVFILFSLSIFFVYSQNPFQFCLKPINHTGSGLTTPRGITSGDFNGDGKIDLAAANQDANNVSVLLGTGTGTFATIVNYGAGASAWGITSDDFNLDGKPDLAVANWSGSNISILLGTGTGSFAAALNFTLGYNPREIISADFNLDGKPDLATTCFGGTNISIFLGAGTGSFSAQVDYVVGSSPWGLISSDFNGDGKLDIATANWGGNNVSIVLGTGLGTFNSAINFSVGSNPQGIASSDFNGDGNADLAVTDYAVVGTSNVAVLLGTGTGSFGAATYYSGGTNFGAITSSDFNDDGNSDLAVLDFGGGGGMIFKGNGTGSFSYEKSFSASAGSKIISTDLNSDGRSDLVSTAYSQYIIPILLNVPPPTITVTSSNPIPCIGDLITFTASGANTYAWSDNGVTTSSIYPSNNIAGFIASNTSTYAVVGINSVTGCTASTIAQVSVSSCAGIPTTKGLEPLSIFPNPATNEIKFKIPYEEKVTIEIYNLVGQLVLRSENCDNLQRYDVSNLSESVYFYKIISKNNFHLGKFYKIIN
ncbi:MAG: T9SS type A sorting domain-containing protein [Bacteroidia bacterium]|jgi:FG-GAP-like repeat/Secretion system C-terminal sorting domain|nr:T9SS type A sorting domain-containing protein [Bacteroidia bacterium]